MTLPRQVISSAFLKDRQQARLISRCVECSYNLKKNHRNNIFAIKTRKELEIKGQCQVKT